MLSLSSTFSSLKKEFVILLMSTLPTENHEIHLRKISGQAASLSVVWMSYYCDTQAAKKFSDAIRSLSGKVKSQTFSSQKNRFLLKSNKLKITLQ